MSELKPCNCNSYNWGIGEKENVILRAPENFGFTKDVCVDYCIAPAIKALWDADIITLNSCCGHGKMKPSIILQESATIDLAKNAKLVVSKVDDREFDFLSWKLVNCESEAQHNTEFKLTTTTKQRDELLSTLSDIYNEAVDYQSRAGKPVTWCLKVGNLLSTIKEQKDAE